LSFTRNGPTSGLLVEYPTHGGILPSYQHTSELVWLFVLNRQSITLFSGYNTIEDLHSLLWRKE